MNSSIRFFFASLLLSGSASAMAHEFWLLAQPTRQPAQGAAVLSISVGEHWEGERLPFTPSYIAQLRHYACGKAIDLTTLLPATESGSGFVAPLGCIGTHIFALDSHPNVITLSADKFTAYLHEEGLDDIIKRREATGHSATPGRERYRRHVKALLQTKGSEERSADLTTRAATRTGQRLEILPVGDPSSQATGLSMRFQLLFDGRPLSNRLVKAWHKPGNQTLTIRGHSNSAGIVAFDFPYVGQWMISTVHMIAVDGAEAVDWDSFWGNLTFSVSSEKKSPNVPRQK